MNGAELWTRRVALGLTPTRLSELLGPGKRTITRWEQRRSNVPDWVAEAVNELYRQRKELIRRIWNEHVGDDGRTGELVLVNREEDVPSYAPKGTTVLAWNNAVVAVFDEADETTEPSVEWNRYAEDEDEWDDS